MKDTRKVTAREVADRIVLIARRTVVAQGPPDEVFRSHAAKLAPFALSSGIDLDRLAPPSAPDRRRRSARAGTRRIHPLSHRQRTNGESTPTPPAASGAPPCNGVSPKPSPESATSERYLRKPSPAQR